MRQHKPTNIYLGILGGVLPAIPGSFPVQDHVGSVPSCDQNMAGKFHTNESFSGNGIYRELSIAMFDYWRVSILGQCSYNNHMMHGGIPT